jgi:hypothetical protein
MKGKARTRRVGRPGYQISSQGQVKLHRDLGLDGTTVEQILVEETGQARLRKGDVILRVFTSPTPAV